MNQEELKTEMGKHMIDILNAVDGDGNRFEFGKTYHYFNYQTMRVETFVSKYSCLALRPTDFGKAGENEACYHHIKNQQDTEFKVLVSALHSTVKPACEKGLAWFPMKKQETLGNIQREVAEVLSTFQDRIKTYDEGEALIQETLKKIK